ncbi:MAG: DUF1569 domain-containing protein [Chitinophagaceae bacterium]
MALPNVFTANSAAALVARINQLAPGIHPHWGKMTVSQMLAHCNVTYEMVYEDKHPKPGFLMKLILKMLVKKTVTNEAPYSHNSRTGPQFVIKDQRDFEPEKKRLIDHIQKTQELGEASFDNRVSHSFGPLKAGEWNNMFYKHLDHHLRQFGV